MTFPRKQCAVPALKQNQFGGTIGGPIDKDRTFFFGSYEGFRQRKGIATSTIVPSPQTHVAVPTNDSVCCFVIAGTLENQDD